MRNKLKSFFKSFKPKSYQERMHDFLGQSVDRFDLERREKEWFDKNGYM